MGGAIAAITRSSGWIRCGPKARSNCSRRCSVKRDPSPDDQLDATLAVLQGGEFINELPGPHDIHYAFKRALTQVVAYNSILSERRKLLHERAGQALEAIFAAQLDDHLSELALHYKRADNIHKAIEYSGRAGQ